MTRDSRGSNEGSPTTLSLAKLEANRANAAKSTGPRTQTGKARSSMNALRHGLLAKGTVVADEDQAAYVELRKALHDELAPVGVLETLLVERVALHLWRLRRAAQAEAEIVGAAARSIRLVDRMRGVAHAPVHSNAITDGRMDLVLRYEGAIERLLARALDELERLQSGRGARPDGRRRTAVLDLSLDASDAEQAAVDLSSFIRQRIDFSVDVLKELRGEYESGDDHNGHE